MSHLDHFCKKAHRVAVRVGEKVEELGEVAALSIKIKRLELEIEELYERLGRVIYRDLHTEKNLEDKKLEIIASIDALFDELSVLRERRSAMQEKKEQ